VQNLQLQLQTLATSISQDRDRQLMLDRLVAEAEAMAAAPPVSTTRGGEVDPSSLTASQLLEIRRAELRGYETRMKPGHPDLERTKREVAELEKQVDAEALQQPLSPGGDKGRPVALNQAEAQRQSRLQEMTAERDALPRRIAQKEKDLVRMRDLLGGYQTRIAAVPARETELVELTRDYETLRQSYTNLLAKSENARMSANLERRQIGEQFRVLEPARLPERPISPNRLQINTMGALGGLALGLGLLLFLEYRDRSMRTEADVRGALGLPVLAVIRTLGEAAQRRRRPWVQQLVAGRWR
jgi:uncharacterized protein involved in exopolysaccharide biosynthesis